MPGTYRAILSSPASMLMRLVFRDKLAGERCASRLLVLLFLGSSYCSGAVLKRVSSASDVCGSAWGEPGGVRSAVKFMCSSVRRAGRGEESALVVVVVAACSKI